MSQATMTVSDAQIAGREAGWMPSTAQIYYAIKQGAVVQLGAESWHRSSTGFRLLLDRDSVLRWIEARRPTGQIRPTALPIQRRCALDNEVVRSAARLMVHLRMLGTREANQLAESIADHRSALMRTGAAARSVSEQKEARSA